MKKILMHILPIFLLLTLCLGVLSGCDLVSASENPDVTETQPTGGDEIPEDDGVFTITDDANVGEMYARVLRGELTFERMSGNHDLTERSNLYVNEYILQFMQRLNTIAVEPVSKETFFAEVYHSGGDGAWIEGDTLDHGTAFGISLKSDYMVVSFGGGKATEAHVGYFKTAQDITELLTEFHKFLVAEKMNPFHGIANSGKVGNDWRRMMADGAVDTFLLSKISVVVHANTDGRLIKLTEEDREKKQALVDVLKTLDEYVVNEIKDLCTCDGCEEQLWEKTGQQLLSVATSNGGVYEGFGLGVYGNVIAITSLETRETAYFQLRDDIAAASIIRNAIMRAVTD